MSFSLNVRSEENIKTNKTTPASSQTRYKQEWLFILIKQDLPLTKAASFISLRHLQPQGHQL